MDKIDSIHDILVDIKGVEPSEVEIEYILNRLPNSILNIGEKWGWFDTEFREKVYELIKEIE